MICMKQSLVNKIHRHARLARASGRQSCRHVDSQDAHALACGACMTRYQTPAQGGGDIVFCFKLMSFDLSVYVTRGRASGPPQYASLPRRRPGAGVTGMFTC